MQNQLGLIKIGQSSSVERRRKRIERDDLCQARIVFVANNMGYKEKLLLRRLTSSQIIGEWHDGDEETRFLIARFFRSKSLSWRFDLASDDQIDSWSDRIELRRTMISHEKLTQRFVRKMQNSYDPAEEAKSRFCDWKIGQIIYEYDAQRNYYTMSDSSGQISVFLDTDEASFYLPTYISNVESALQTFPAYKKPNHWEGSAWDCCVQGLIARREAMIARHKELLIGWENDSFLEQRSR